jgi:hypothetical protein
VDLHAFVQNPSDAAELLLIPVADAPASKPLIDRVKGLGAPWDARFLATGHPGFAAELAGPTLVVGTVENVARLCQGMPRSAGTEREPVFALPDPSEIPRFPEEGQPSRQSAVRAGDAWPHFFEGGALAARIHAEGYRFIDMHPGQYGTSKRTRANPPGERAVLVDYPAAVAIHRPPTARERAQDLGVMKLHCSFAQWEAVKEGYRLKAPEHAPAVFRLI